MYNYEIFEYFFIFFKLENKYICFYIYQDIY